MRKIVLSMMVAGMLASPAIADFATGMAAFKRGDDAGAIREWKSAAERGHTGAQLQLATSYSSGMGVERNDAEALRWYRMAAEQDVADAQASLGFMYRSGRGTARDDVQAFFWLSLAADHGDEHARVEKDRLSRNLDEDRLREAEMLVWRWRKRR